MKLISLFNTIYFPRKSFPHTKNLKDKIMFYTFYEKVNYWNFLIQIFENMHHKKTSNSGKNLFF